MTDLNLYSTEDIGTAARLLAMGLRVKQRPAGNKEYADLIRRWQESARIQEALAAMVGSQSMILLGVDIRDGVMLAAERISPFSLGITDLRSNASGATAAHIAIVYAAIVATFFPTSDSVDNDDNALPALRPSQIIHTLAELIRSLEEKATNEALPEDVMHIWRSLGRLQVMADRKDDAQRDRANLKSLEGLVKLSLKHMADNNLTTAVNEDEIIQARERMRLQLRHHGIPTLLEIARTAVSRHGIASPFALDANEDEIVVVSAAPDDSAAADVS